MTPEYDHARKCAEHYRRIGLCPLPSRMDVKGPLMPSYAEHYGTDEKPAEPVPESVYEGWATTNLQIITGTKSPTPTKLVVVDCDGEEAVELWHRILERNEDTVEGCWVSITGSGGVHTYYSLPDGVESCPGGLLWGLWDTYGRDGRGGWVKHKELRLLADNALVVAPPSIHVETGRPYQFTGTLNPRRVRIPRPAPGWLLSMPRLCTPRFHEPPAPRGTMHLGRPASGATYRREEVLDAMGDQKLSVAKEWGLVTKSDRPNPRGWVNCYVPWREDPATSNSPSGSFHYLDGTLQDRRDLETVPFFDLGVRIGRFQTWTECRDWCGDRFIGRRPAAQYKHQF
jgi:hypothetical protein